MKHAEGDQPTRYPMLALSDEELRKEIFSLLSKSVNPVAEPYSEDGSYVAAIAGLTSATS